MRTRALTAAVTTVVLVALSAPAWAAGQPSPPEPRQENSPWVAIIALVVVAAVAGGMLLIANAYRKNSR